MDTIKQHCPAVWPARQRGMSSIVFLIVAGAGALALVCALKILPLYIENWSIDSILDGVAEEYLASKESSTSKSLRSSIAKRFNINQINGISSKDIEIERTKSHYLVSANYERRVALFGNIDVVVKFENNVVELPLQK